MADLKELADEITSAMADLLASAQENQANTGAIANTLAEMLEALKEGREQVAPQMNVTVQPAEVVVMPTARYIEHIDHEYDKSGRIVRSTPVYKGA